jgi:hypothetical protein
LPPIFSPTPALCPSAPIPGVLSLLAATLAKLSVGLTLGTSVRGGTRGDEAAGGVRGRVVGRSDPDREFVLDIDKRSRSLSTRSVIAFSRTDTSTGLHDESGKSDVDSIIPCSAKRI